MSVIRMVKMFGWEKKMATQIDEKREIELTWVWWNKVYSLSTLNFQFRVFSFSRFNSWLKLFQTALLFQL